MTQQPGPHSDEYVFPHHNLGCVPCPIMPIKSPNTTPEKPDKSGGFP